jgi:DNA repair exonuclease SbcCD nuclease subunit
MLKIVHCADIHAGRPASRELDEEKASLRRREIETGLQRIVDLCRREKAHLLLISGDLFEHLYVRPSWVKEASAVFQSMPGTRVFISPGNHDPVVRGSLYRSIDWPGNVTVFTSSEIREVPLNDAGAAVYGFGWTSYVERREVLKGFAARRPDLVNILVIHGDWQAQGAASQYLPVLPSDLENSGMDYVALGHIHAPGEFRAGKSIAVYPGCPEPLDFGDQGERGVYLVTVTDKPGEKGEAGTGRGAAMRGPAGGPDAGRSKVTAEFIPLSLRQMRSVRVDVTGLDTPERVRNAVLSAGDPSARKRDLWAVTLAGMVDPELGLDVPLLERELGQEFFFLKINPDYRPAYDLAALGDPRNQSLESRFVREMQAAWRTSLDRGEARAASVADHALYYGLDALRQGRILLRKGGSE